MSAGWTVYLHVSPSNKVYVGITSNIKNRWGSNGRYYCIKETAFSRAIRKHGWENFSHIIVKSGLSKDEAGALEKELIAFYKSYNISYNTTDGGEGYAGKHTREHVNNRIKSRVSNQSVDYLVIDKDFNYIVCVTTTEVAEILNTSARVVTHVLQQPIGYTCKKCYLWKHNKEEDIDIQTIKKKVLEALSARKQKMSEHTKSILPIMQERLKEVRSAYTKEQRQKMYTSYGMLGKKHSEESKKRISIKAKGRTNKQRDIL